MLGASGETSLEYAAPPIGTSTGAQVHHPKWIRVVGTTGSQIQIHDGEVFVASRPGPLSPVDLAHMALAGEIGGTGLHTKTKAVALQ